MNGGEIISTIFIYCAASLSVQFVYLSQYSGYEVDLFLQLMLLYFMHGILNLDRTSKDFYSYLLHHLVGFISILIAMFGPPKYVEFVIKFLIYEISTPLLNLSLYYKNKGVKALWTNLGFLITYTLARIIYGTYLTCEVLSYLNGSYLSLLPLSLQLVIYWWYYKILRITYRTIFPKGNGKKYIDPLSFRRDCYKLASLVVKDGFKPDFMVALWRGGAPVGCYVHELLKYKSINTDHIAIRTSRYTGIDTVNNNILVHNFTYLKDVIFDGAKVLIVDDVWDSGLSIEAVINKFKQELPGTFDIRVATVYYKPTRNKLQMGPNYYVSSSNEWLVFPHELEDMTHEEIETVMGSDILQIVKSC